jgi:hypothetical protein
MLAALTQESLNPSVDARSLKVRKLPTVSGSSNDSHPLDDSILLLIKSDPKNGTTRVVILTSAAVNALEQFRAEGVFSLPTNISPARIRIAFQVRLSSRRLNSLLDALGECCYDLS